MKILILYYSGVGNTKMVGEKIAALIRTRYEVTINCVEQLPSSIVITDYDALVIGFPTIHATPAQPILAFLEKMKMLSVPIPTFLFTTCGLYSANALRVFAKRCQQKNIIPVLNRSYRCAATDGVLLAPWMKIWFRHEKNLDCKIEKDVNDFLHECSAAPVAKIPHFRLYSIFNYPNQFFGQRFSPQIYTHQQNCIVCGKCMRNCPAKSINQNEAGYPFIDNKRCIHCYRCIHHCPKKALSLSKKHPPSKTLYCP